MPDLQAANVAGQVAVVGVLAETRLRPLNVAADNLIPIDTSVLRRALPESILRRNLGHPEIRPIAAFYGPGERSNSPPRSKIRAINCVSQRTCCCHSAKNSRLRGGFTFTPQAAKQTAFAFRMPSEWQLQKVLRADQQALT